MYVTCKHCGRIHVAVTRGYAEVSIQTFNNFFDKASPETQSNYGRRASMETYTRCISCNCEQFRKTKDEELSKIFGCTLSPIVWEELDSSFEPTRDQ